jgi:hypothetical protein
MPTAKRKADSLIPAVESSRVSSSRFTGQHEIVPKLRPKITMREDYFTPVSEEKLLIKPKSVLHQKESYATTTSKAFAKI